MRYGYTSGKLCIILLSSNVYNKAGDRRGESETTTKISMSHPLLTILETSLNFLRFHAAYCIKRMISSVINTYHSDMTHKRDDMTPKCSPTLSTDMKHRKMDMIP